uniref:NADH dehydrogenase subunit 6 n=1 Tax=Parasagitta elegans TaxID=1562708 RepID=A0A141CLH4_9BILA|nr:NADH dehydrogenase subunit 6 [Parasagitta elegans]
MSFSFLAMSSPFLVAGLFVWTLCLGGLVVGAVDSFLGLIVFVVYVGGALVIFSYCFMLTPLQESSTNFTAWSLPALCVALSGPSVAHSSLYEFYWVSCLLVSVGVLLFVVMVCVVDLIDFSEGAMRVL